MVAGTMDLLTFISLLVFLGIICASEGAPIPNIGKVAEEIKTSLGSGAEVGKLTFHNLAWIKN